MSKIYNLFLALATAYGLRDNQVVLVRATMYIYIGAGVILIASTRKLVGGALQIVPAALALVL